MMVRGAHPAGRSDAWAVPLTMMLLGGLIAVLLAAGFPAPASANAIQVENSLPGTTAWELPGSTPTNLTNQSTQINGYASESSAAPGDTVHMHVSTTPAAGYRIEVYRLGWYQGTGGRLIACLPSCAGSEPGVQQPVPAPDPTTGLLDAGWPITDAITVGSNWTSGYYLAKLVLTSGPYAGQASYIAFIVRAAPGRTSGILVQASVNTWQAYNPWGGKSLYTFNSTSSKVPTSATNAASQVSFNRPGLGSGQGPLPWEYNLVRFLEENGYDVSYQADTDTDQNPGSLLGHRLDIVAGHDEYWTKSMRDAWDAARNSGVNLAFMGANDGYWQARYADATDRTLIEYRSATLDPDSDPTQKTVRFRSLNPSRPECRLEGEQDLAGLNNNTPNPDYRVVPSGLSNPWLAGTGFTASSTITNVVGYEWDTAGQPGCPAVQRLFTWIGTNTYGQPSQADASTYTAPSGARVFAAGSFQFSWGLDNLGHSNPTSPQLQRFTQNMLNDLTAVVPVVPVPGPFGLASPAAGAVLWTPRPKLSWTVSTEPGSAGLSYRVSIDRRLLATTTGLRLTAPRDLADGRHVWTVVAVDRLGHSHIGGTRSFTVSTVRLVKRSRAGILLRGYALLVYCEHRCSARISIRLGRRGPALSLLRHSTGPGVASLSVPMTKTLRSRLAHLRSAHLTISVRTRSGHTSRSVGLTARW
jgi:hypothetical protein